MLAADVVTIRRVGLTPWRLLEIDIAGKGLRFGASAADDGRDSPIPTSTPGPSRLPSCIEYTPVSPPSFGMSNAPLRS
eukprot:scaffold8307_cov119-Isochrysis_galbana.AAC.1